MDLRLLRFPMAVPPVDPAVDAWFDARPGQLGELARHWFDVLRGCGADVRELLHDGHPTACVGDAGFAYVNVFGTHLNLGFFRGAELADPDALLQGSGRFMRHVKLGPAHPVDSAALQRLLRCAYEDMRARWALLCPR